MKENKLQVRLFEKCLFEGSAEKEFNRAFFEW